MPFPFEVPFEEVLVDLDPYVEAVSGALRSEFLTLPKGDGFVEYPVFEEGYQALKRATQSFRELSPPAIVETVSRLPMAFVVLRAMLGFTPSEWAYIATQRTGVVVPQGACRTLDRAIRTRPAALVPSRGVTSQRLVALITVACELLTEGVPAGERTPELIHRLDKADTRDGLTSMQPMADLGVPYAMLLYERFLGRPFAGHRDSVSELVGDVVETAIEGVLSRSGISYRKSKRAERVAGFDQAPDFIIPDEFNPRIVIEAKLAEDDGTARDKVTRVQHLSTLSREGLPGNAEPRFEVVACIAGRGFKVRRQDIAKLIIATRGKVFTMQTINQLVEHTELSRYRTR